MNPDLPQWQVASPVGIDPTLITPRSPSSSSSTSSSTTSSEDEAPRAVVKPRQHSHILQDSSDQSELPIRKHKSKPTPRIRSVDSSEDEAWGPSRQRKKVTRPQPKPTRAPDLPIPTIKTVREQRIPAIKVIKPDQCSREGVQVKFHRARPDQDPMEYEFRVSERTVCLLCSIILM